MAATPRRRSSGESESSLLSAPRSLKDEVNWRFSNFRWTSQPTIRDRVRDQWLGVRSTAPLMLAAAARMSSSVTSGNAAGSPGDCVIVLVFRAGDFEFVQSASWLVAAEGFEPPTKG